MVCNVYLVTIVWNIICCGQSLSNAAFECLDIKHHIKHFPCERLWALHVYQEDSVWKQFNSLIQNRMIEKMYIVDKQRFFFASIVGSIYSILCSFPLSRLTFLWDSWKGLTSRKLTTSGMCSHYIARMEDTTFPHVVWSVWGSILVVATGISIW